jgi:acyl-coenzyme A thioesterase PaaI-like protein
LEFQPVENLMPESYRTRLMRWYFNFFPAYRGTGARVTYISGDWREIRIRLPLSLRTRNYVGTIYGGSMYAAVDPMYMIMLIHCLGPGYTVWDKDAYIRFKKPGRSTLFAAFRLEEEEIRTIQQILEQQTKVDRVYQVNLVDKEGVLHACIEKTIHIRRKEPKA